MPACSRDRSPFLELHFWQAVTRFSQESLPFWDLGMRWSIVRFWLLPQ